MNETRTQMLSQKELHEKARMAYRAWANWDSYEFGRKGEMYFDREKMEFGLIQHTDRQSHGVIGENDFWIPVSGLIRDYEDRVCRSAKPDEIIKKIEDYVASQLG